MPQNVAFSAPVDIGNRALQRVGSPRMLSFSDNTKEASEVFFVYDKLRQAELQRNIWRFAIRVAALRPYTPDMKLLSFSLYNGATAYSFMDIIVSAVDGNIYICQVANTGHEPSASPTYWVRYFGPDIATQFITSWILAFTYAKGDQVVGSDGAGYVALSATTGNNPTTDGGVHWALDSTITGIQFNSTQNAYTAANSYGQINSFYAGELTRVGAVTYVSLANNNTDIPVWSGTTKWMALTALPTQSPYQFVYPIGAGPFSDASTKNVYRLPVGYLKEAPQDPKSGQAQFLGAPDGSQFEDWNFQDRYFTSWGTGLGANGQFTTQGVIAFRFVADVTDVTLMTSMFCEGLACRIGEEVCEVLTQSTDKIKICQALYKQFMGDARTMNLIEIGPIYPPEDSYITCRY